MGPNRSTNTVGLALTPFECQKRGRNRLPATMNTPARSCGQHVEAVQSFTHPPPATSCPHCGGRAAQGLRERRHRLEGQRLLQDGQPVGHGGQRLRQRRAPTLRMATAPAAIRPRRRSPRRRTQVAPTRPAPTRRAPTKLRPEQLRLEQRRPEQLRQGHCARLEHGQLRDQSPLSAMSAMARV